MKKNLLTIFGIAILGIGLQVTLSSSSNGRAFSANSGNTGAPGEVTTCRSCHGTGFGTTVSIVIKDSVGNPITSYVPGTIYTAEFTVNANGASRYGYQLVSLTGSNTPVNGFANPDTNTRLVTLANGRQYAEHAGKSIVNMFTTQWTAPVLGTGNVRFYGGGAAVNNNGTTGGDGGNTATLSLTENTSVGIAKTSIDEGFSVYPNPVKDIIYLRGKSAETGVYVAELFDMQGKLVFSKDIIVNQQEVNSISTEQVKSGNYILRLHKDGVSVQKKLIVL